MAKYRVEIRVERQQKNREPAVKWRALALPGFVEIRHDVVRPPLADAATGEVHAIIAINMYAQNKGESVSASDVEVHTVHYTDGVVHEGALTRPARPDLFARATNGTGT